jgi:hypothetical protein
MIGLPNFKETFISYADVLQPGGYADFRLNYLIPAEHNIEDASQIEITDSIQGITQAGTVLSLEGETITAKIGLLTISLIRLSSINAETAMMFTVRAKNSGSQLVNQLKLGVSVKIPGVPDHVPIFPEFPNGLPLFSLNADAQKDFAGEYSIRAAAEGETLTIEITHEQNGVTYGEPFITTRVIGPKP